MLISKEGACQSHCTIMPGTDSDDDLVPLIHRHTAQQAAKSKVLASPSDVAGPSQPQQAPQPSSAIKLDSDDDDLPDWVQNYRVGVDALAMQRVSDPTKQIKKFGLSCW
jgi:hypothetical protein